MSPTLIGTMANAAGNVSIYQSIYLSRGSVCPFQCSREVGNALFSTCAHYNWRLASNIGDFKQDTWHSGNDADDSGTTTTEIRDT